MLLLFPFLAAAAAAEDAVREMLCDFSSARDLPEVGTVTAEDQLDDGSKICLAITIDRYIGLLLLLHGST
jgi:5-oxoprolinase (ATP-hydrolysing)